MEEDIQNYSPSCFVGHPVLEQFREADFWWKNGRGKPILVIYSMRIA